VWLLQDSYECRWNQEVGYGHSRTAATVSIVSIVAAAAAEAAEEAAEDKEIAYLVTSLRRLAQCCPRPQHTHTHI